MTDSLHHIPVLSEEVLSELIDETTQSVFDGTLGLGGHAELTLSKYSQLKNYIATDLDQQHLDFATNRLKSFGAKAHLHQGSFSTIGTHVTCDTERPLSILLDLGLCSNQIDTPEKGFSFKYDGPLKMSFAGETAAEDFLNEAEKEKLTKVFYEYGEIKHAPKIADAIIEARPLKTTEQLKTVIESVTHPPLQKKTLVLAFQAIRIEVNNELTVLEKTLDDAFELMKPNDKLGVISYHSLEDRIVKKKFSRATKPLTQSDDFSLHSVVKEADFRLQTKKPITPSIQEIESNPRARSAKFRIIQKVS